MSANTTAHTQMAIRNTYRGFFRAKEALFILIRVFEAYVSLCFCTGFLLALFL